jgi:hypothetical protein
MKKITRAEFDKKVDQEFAYLTYQERMSEDKARAQARKTVSQEYEVE